MMNWEMCKKLKYDLKNKWYIHNFTAVQEDDIHKLLLDFEIQMNHLKSARFHAL